MIKARIGRLERILGHFVEPFLGTFRVVEVWDNDPVPTPGPDEEFLVLNIIRTPHPPARDPTNGDGAIAEADLEAQVKILEAERDALKARASEGESIRVPRRARSFVKNPGEKRGER